MNPNEAIQDLNEAKTNANAFFQSLRSLLASGLINAIQTLIQQALAPHSKTQQRVLAALRSAVGVVAIYYSNWLNLPLAALLGAGLTATAPDVAQPLLEALEAVLTQLWHHLHIKTRMGLFAISLAVLMIGWFGGNVWIVSGLVSLVANLIAIKVAGELTLINLGKEERHVERVNFEREQDEREPRYANARRRVARPAPANQNE